MAGLSMKWPDRIKDWASAVRDAFGVLFTPVVTVLAGVLVWIFAWGAWDADTEPQRLNYLGAALIMSVALVGLGGQWLQRTRVERLKGSGPGGLGFEIETEEETPKAVVTTTTTTAVEK
jgi:hypothetical protein